jgi:hypothetical protein
MKIQQRTIVNTETLKVTDIIERNGEFWLEITLRKIAKFSSNWKIKLKKLDGLNGEIRKFY